MKLRRFLLGKPLPTHGLEDETLSNILALPIFSSDALSSVAYATQEMMLALIIAGTMAFHASIGMAFAIVALLFILTASYNQTIFAYPQGGGAYNVAHDNLGVLAAQVAAVSLMTDYILTVAVSVAAGIDAILSACAPLPEIQRLDPGQLIFLKVVLCICAIWFIVWMNIRGITESGRVFAIPVYIFIFSILALIAIGLWHLHQGVLIPPRPPINPDTSLPWAPWPHFFPDHPGEMGLYLILHSFASGCTALTGLEAISNSAAAFKKPKSRNAAITMRWLAASLGTMLLGITYLAQYLAKHGLLVPMDPGETVISQIAHAAVGGGWFYWCIQISTFLVLVLAANTSFTGFPRLSAMVAEDGFLPRQFRTLGDRLVFSNGILILGCVATVILIILKGSVDRLIPLYAIGVYLAFTLSQAGMVQRWRKTRQAGWLVRAIMNGIGAAITMVVAIIFGVVKFKDGAWIVLILIPCATFLLHRIGKHYDYVRAHLKPVDYQPRTLRTHVALVPAHAMTESVLGALEYGRHIASTVEILEWSPGGTRLEPFSAEGVRMTLDTGSPSWRAAVLNRIRALRASEDALITIVLSEDIPFTGFARFFIRFTDLVIKLSLLNERGIVVTDTRRYRHGTELLPRSADGSLPLMPHTALVLVPSLHRGVLEGLAYARRISKDVSGTGRSSGEIQALSIEIEPRSTPLLRQSWDQYVPDVSLLIMESPFRQLRDPLIRYIRALRLHKPGCIITVVVPEFVADRWWNKMLHNQSGLLLKLALRSESGIVLANPRYFIENGTTLTGSSTANGAGTLPDHTSR